MDVGGARGASRSQPQQDGPAQHTLQFVNITSSVTLDEASRMGIRAQVMRDWHRRKKQQPFTSGSAARVAENSGAGNAATTAWTNRFKLGARSLLPRSPISSRPKIRPKDAQAPELGREHELAWRPHENVVVNAATAAQDGQLMHAEATEGKTSQSTTTLQSNHTNTAGEQQWLWNLEHFLQTDTLHNVPSSGALDPFNAMSLLITPRTQQLLHYYC
jgi:hypothetical protein